MNHKDEEVSINLSNSLKTNKLSESLQNNSRKETANAQQNGTEALASAELHQLKDMIKDYR
jgi:hypothetical protein